MWKYVKRWQKVQGKGKRIHISMLMSNAFFINNLLLDQIWWAISVSELYIFNISATKEIKNLSKRKKILVFSDEREINWNKQLLRALACIIPSHDHIFHFKLILYTARWPCWLHIILQEVIWKINEPKFYVKWNKNSYFCSAEWIKKTGRYFSFCEMICKWNKVTSKRILVGLMCSEVHWLNSVSHYLWMYLSEINEDFRGLEKRCLFVCLIDFNFCCWICW